MLIEIVLEGELEVLEGSTPKRVNINDTVYLELEDDYQIDNSSNKQKSLLENYLKTSLNRRLDNFLYDTNNDDETLTNLTITNRSISLIDNVDLSYKDKSNNEHKLAQLHGFYNNINGEDYKLHLENIVGNYSSKLYISEQILIKDTIEQNLVIQDLESFKSDILSKNITFPRVRNKIIEDLKNRKVVDAFKPINKIYNSFKESQENNLKDFEDYFKKIDTPKEGGEEYQEISQSDIKAKKKKLNLTKINKKTKSNNDLDNTKNRKPK